RGGGEWGAKAAACEAWWRGSEPARRITPVVGEFPIALQLPERAWLLRLLLTPNSGQVAGRVGNWRGNPCCVHGHSGLCVVATENFVRVDGVEFADDANTLRCDDVRPDLLAGDARRRRPLPRCSASRGPRAPPSIAGAATVSTATAAACDRRPVAL